MEQHLSSEQVAAYRGRRLPPGDLLAVSSHVAGCPQCRDRICDPAEAAQIAQRLFAAIDVSSAHIHEDRLDQLAAGSSDPVEQEHEHLAGCPDCADSLQALRRLKARMIAAGVFRDAPVPHRPFWHAPFAWIPALATVTAVVIAGVWVIGRGGPGETLAALRDRGRTVVVEKGGRLRGIDGIPPVLQAQASRALMEQQLSRPGFLGELIAPADELRGGTTPETVRILVAPVGTAVDTNRPSFSWKAVPGAASYSVGVFHGFTEVTQSGPLQGTQWTPSTPLPDGNLVWELHVTFPDGRRVKAAPLTQSEARFRVLDAAERTRVSAERAAVNGSNLVLGTVALKAGLLDEAEQDWEQLAAENPDSSTARQLLDNLRRIRRP